MGVESKAAARLAALFDDGIYTELDSKADASVITAVGYVSGTQCYAFSQNIEVENGAMSKSQAKKISRIYDLAEKTGYPVVGIYDSLGGKVSEGLAAMSGYAELVNKADRLSGVVPQISVIAGTCAASASIWAMCSDMVVMSKDGELFVTAPSLTEEAVGSQQTAVTNGTAHIAAENDEDALAKVREILLALPCNNLCAPYDTDAVASTADINTDAVAAVADADSLIELRKGYGTDTVTALARMNGTSVGIVQACGTLTADDCRKIVSLIGLCDAFTLPVITIVDTVGFEKSADGELDGIVKSASILTKAYAEATTVKITLITGNCYGPAYLTFAGSSDAVYALDSATVAAMSPDTAALIVNKDKMLSDGVDAAVAEYDATALTAAEGEYIDDVVEAENAVARLHAAVNMLASKRVSTLDKKHTVLSF